MLHKKILMLLFFFGVAMLQHLKAQITDEVAGAGTFHDLTAGVCENKPFTITAHTASLDAIPNCNAAIGAISQDSWFNFVSNQTGILALSVTPDVGRNLAIAVYDGANSSVSLLNCSNKIATADLSTETVLVSTIANNTYTVRLISLTAGDYNGFISIYPGPEPQRDLCVNAVNVSIGTCDFQFDIDNGFIHNEANSLSVNCGQGAQTIASDGWLKIDLAQNTRIRVEYTNSNKNASIQAYSGTCGNLTSLGCADLYLGTTNAEFLEFTANLAGTNTYFIRIANLEDSQSMAGEVCIEEVIPRDQCATVVAHSAQIRLGDCGVRVYVPTTFNLDNAVPGCNDALTYDNAWLKYAPTANTRVRLEISSNAIVGLAVVTLATAGDCSSTKNLVGGASACIAASGSNSASYSFDVTAGQTYYFEIVGDQSGGDFTAFACLYEDAKKSEDVFYAANVLDAAGLDCGKIFNILVDFEADGANGTMAGLLNPLAGCTGSVNSLRDAWGSFQLTTGVPAAGMLVEFDNNDGRNSTTALNTALQVFRGGTIQTATSVDDNDCAAADAATTSINVNSIVKGLSVDQPITATTICTVGSLDNEKWIRYQHGVATQDVRVAFKSTSTANFAIEVYSACGTPIAGACGGKGISLSHTSGFPDLATAAFTATNGVEYFIRVASVGAITGDISVNITSELFPMGCANNVVEGNESVLLSGGTFTNNTQYYFRIATIQTGGTNSVSGRACIRNNDIPQGDICSNATGLLVGDCDIDFDLTGDAVGEDRFFNNQTVPPGGFGSVGRDGWISFTATASRSTVEYTQSNTAQDAVLEVYRGNCTALNRVSDINNSTTADAVISPAVGVEKFVFNSIPGVLYFVRIIKKGAASNLFGKLCIYNTVARDACIDNDLLTLAVGDCNRTVDIPRSFDNAGGPGDFPNLIAPSYRNFLTGDALPFTETGGSLTQYVQTSCETEAPFTNTYVGPNQLNSRDGWFRLIGNGNEVTVSFTTTSANDNPSIVVYTALKSVGPVNCGTGLSGANNPANQYACANNVTAMGEQTETVTFRTNGGQQYLIRIIDLSAALSKDMTGILCISDGRNNYNNPCINDINGPRQVSIGSCSVPMNVTDDNVSTACFTPGTIIAGGNFDDDAAGTTCDNCVNRDAWATITRPFVCDPAVAAPTPTTTVVAGSGGTTIISCPRPYRVNLGTDGAIGGTGSAADRCECGSNATNNCAPPPLSSAPAAGGGCTCPAGYVCVDADPTAGVANRCVPAGYQYNLGLNGTFDANGFDDYFEPIATLGVCPAPYSVFLGADNAIGGTGVNADVCVCAQQTIRTTHPNSFTIEYDNRNGVSDVAADYSMIIYQTTNCNDENAYTRLTCLPASAPTNVERVEKHTITGLPMTHGSGGETYFVRILNKSTTKTLFGNLCTYFGSDLASPSCFTFPLNDYGELEGEFKNFASPVETSDANRNLPTTTIPNCVLPGGSNPASQSPNPIRADAWMQFTVPIGSNYGSVSVQFDNTSSVPLRNVAMAIYTAPEIPTGTSNVRDNGTTNLSLNCRTYGAADPNPANTPNRGGLFLLDCQNTVLSGNETSTFNISYTNGAQPANVPTNIARTYYVRIMNVHNEATPTAFTGRIRVFPAAACDLGSELVVDGDFDMWPAITYPSGFPTNTAVANTAAGTNTFNAERGSALMAIPNITNNDPYPNDIDGVFGASSGAPINTGVARYATDYGYIRESGTYQTGNQRIRYQDTRTSTEFNPEGLYAIRQSPWTLKQDWFCFGVGFSGYGGRTGGGEPQLSYCTTGGGAGLEPCTNVSLQANTSEAVNTTGAFNTTHTADGTTPYAFTEDGLPASFPTQSAANFMIVNGSYNPAGGLPPGKIWCQTVPRTAADVNDVSYYMFSIWVQNMISAGRNLDVPQMRLTVCDMENPSSPGNFPAERDIYTTANGDAGADDQRNTRLPGITDVSTTDASFAPVGWGVTGLVPGLFPEENAAQRVRHLPRPGNNRLFALVSSGPRPSSYGAAMTCNLSQGNGWTSAADNVNESMNARLKVLGASFLVPERPDNWVLIRCIYRAPRTVKEMNLCIENLSLTKNGNDLGVDRISFRKCNSADAETFDRLLKGDPCALSTTGRLVGIPLSASILDFSAKLLGDRVALIWTSMGEDATSHYQIQRSIDGANFSPIGTQDAKGSSQYNNYEWIDANLPFGIKNIYYRLVIVNKDGLEKMSSVLAVEIPSIEHFDLKLKPNPINRGGEFTLMFNAMQAGQASISITDLVGNELMRKVVDLKAGAEEITVKTGNLKAGLYIVRMAQGGKVATKKLVIN